MTVRRGPAAPAARALGLSSYDAHDHRRARLRVRRADRRLRARGLLRARQARPHRRRGEGLPAGQVTNDVVAWCPARLYAAFLTHKGKMLGDLRVLAYPRRRAAARHRARRAAGPLQPAAALHRPRRRAAQAHAGARPALPHRPARPGGRRRGGPPERSTSPRRRARGRAGTARRDRRRRSTSSARPTPPTPSARRTAPPAPARLAGRGRVVRVEPGRPRFGVDLDATVIPQEAGLNERAVWLKKGCYVGQETVARLHYRGEPNRHLRGLRMRAPPRAAPAAPDEREVGRVSSWSTRRATARSGWRSCGGRRGRVLPSGPAGRPPRSSTCLRADARRARAARAPAQAGRGPERDEPAARSAPRAQVERAASWAASHAARARLGHHLGGRAGDVASPPRSAAQRPLVRRRRRRPAPPSPRRRPPTSQNASRPRAARVLGEHEPRARVRRGQRPRRRRAAPSTASRSRRRAQPRRALEALLGGGRAHLRVEVGQQRRAAVAARR